MQKTLTVDEICKLLGQSPRSVYELIAIGAMKVKTKRGKRILPLRVTRKQLQKAFVVSEEELKSISDRIG